MVMTWMTRALKVCEERKISQAELARAIKVEPARITEWKKGVKEAYARQVLSAAEFLGVSMDWLMTGEGSELPDRETDLGDGDRLLLQTAKTLRFEPAEAIAALLAARQQAAQVVASRVLRQQPEAQNPPAPELDRERNKPGRK